MHFTRRLPHSAQRKLTRSMSLPSLYSYYGEKRAQEKCNPVSVPMRTIIMETKYEITVVYFSKPTYSEAVIAHLCVPN